MLLAIALILLVLWLLGFIVVPVGGSLIHILLIIVIILVILHFVQGRRSV
ncbi:MAG TPA: lmo0937 family membrane protein [Candidatus Dormibacteraeota bacterium]